MKVNFRQFCEDHDVALVVPSRDRAADLKRNTDRLASDYILFWCGDGYDSTEYHCIERVEVPRGVHGRPAVLNFALRHLDQRVVIFCDDDVKRVHWLGEDHMMHIGPEQFMLMLMNLVVCALDAKASVFGINENDIRKSSPLFPFHTRAMVGALIGVVGRNLWFDERNKLKADYDLCLQGLKRDRLVWKDLRYFLFQDRNIMAGGSMPFRTVESELAEVENLRQWWGSDVVNYTDGKVTKRLGIRVG